MLPKVKLGDCSLHIFIMLYIFINSQYFFAYIVINFYYFVLR